MRMPSSTIISCLKGGVNGAGGICRGCGGIECDSDGSNATGNVSRATARLVRGACAQIAVAGESRSVSSVGVGDYAAADQGGGGDCALSRISAEVSDGGEAGGGAGGVSAGCVERAGILPAGADDACSGESDRAGDGRAVSFDCGGMAGIAGNWGGYGGSGWG